MVNASSVAAVSSHSSTGSEARIVVHRSNSGGSASVGAAVVVVLDVAGSDVVDGATVTGGTEVTGSANVVVACSPSPPQEASATTTAPTARVRTIGSLTFTPAGYPGPTDRP